MNKHNDLQVVINKLEKTLLLTEKDIVENNGDYEYNIRQYNSLFDLYNCYVRNVPEIKADNWYKINGAYKRLNNEVDKYD